MEKMDEQVWKGWLTTHQAAQVSGYSVAYMRRLVREGRVKARKIQREWLVNRESLLGYKDRMDNLGRAKFSPRRADN